MWSFIKICFFIGLNCGLYNCQSQIKNEIETTSETTSIELVGGGCDGCELMYVCMPSHINAIDTSQAWTEKGQKLLITGTVYQLGGKKPAPDVIIYYWHTDNEGFYSPSKEMDSQAKRHGNIRGWVKSDANGHYSIYTRRPATYPNRSGPAHIHISIKEPKIKNEYYIDEFVFDDDPLLTSKLRNSFENRGGSGILRTLIDGDLQIAEHDIILGLHIPNYPKTLSTKKQSGLDIGEANPSFTPFHAYGPDQGTRTCPVCKYGRYNGILYFVGNHPKLDEMKKWLSFLETESDKRSKYLKVYFVYGNDINYSKEKRQAELGTLGKDLNLQKVALTYVPSFFDLETQVVRNQINPMLDNTFIIYKNRTIIDKYLDLKPTSKNFKMLAQVLDKSENNYFNLPEPKHD